MSTLNQITKSFLLNEDFSTKSYSYSLQAIEDNLKSIRVSSKKDRKYDIDGEVNLAEPIIIDQIDRSLKKRKGSNDCSPANRDEITQSAMNKTIGQFYKKARKNN